MDNIRVSELAKELNLTSKELIEKFGEISITVKSHSNILTPDQIRKIKEHLGVAPKKSAAKKAFIVKKAKPSEEPEVVKTEAKEPAKIEKVERIERVQRVEKAHKIEVIERFSFSSFIWLAFTRFSSICLSRALRSLSYNFYS